MECAHRCEEGFEVVIMRDVPASRNHDELASGNLLRESPGRRRRRFDELSNDEEWRNLYCAQPWRRIAMLEGPAGCEVAGTPHIFVDELTECRSAAVFVGFARPQLAHEGKSR